MGYLVTAALQTSLSGLNLRKRRPIHLLNYCLGFFCKLLRFKTLQFVGMIASNEFLVLNVMSQLELQFFVVQFFRIHL